MDENPIDLTKRLYDLNNIKYTIYKSNNRFDGTPIPEGYYPVYIPNNEICPDALQLNKKKESND